MINSNRFSIPLALAFTAAIPLFANGCSSSGSNPLCCNEFEVGGTVSANISSDVKSQVLVQGIADISGIASSSVDNLTTACRGIATDLGADAAAVTAAEGKTGTDRMKAWCALAEGQIKATLTAAGNVTLKIDAQPAVCSASLDATADCQAKCDVNAKCDFKASPPKCTGGTLEIDCKADCTAMAGVSIDCTGSCMGGCTGSCTGSATVAANCNGKCDGTCAAKAGVGDGMGAHADGTCQGTCSGKCDMKADVKIDCNASCSGKCDATCKGSATASVKCSGTCMGDYKPLSCEGGKLEGGCTASADCQGSCNASVNAKASCTPPSIKVVFTGGASLDGLGKLQATLEANLPLVFSINAKLAIVANAGGSVVGNFSAIGNVKPACIPAIAQAAGEAAGNLTDSFTASGSLLVTAGGSGATQM